MVDPISDMLTRIRNASAVGKEEIVLPYSKFKLNLAQILEKESFIRKVELIAPLEEKRASFKQIKCILKYNGKTPVIKYLKKISKPGQRIYTKKNKIPRIFGRKGLIIVSTPQGLMTGREAIEGNLGGELICEIY
jgi:small subunit ribosomal protein S8